MKGDPIVKPLYEALDRARLAAAVQKPDGLRSENYQMGFLQGKYAGIQEAILVLEKQLEENEHDA